MKHPFLRTNSYTDISNSKSSFGDCLRPNQLNRPTVKQQALIILRKATEFKNVILIRMAKSSLITIFSQIEWENLGHLKGGNTKR